MVTDAPFLTPKEVAEILGVHQKTVHQWLRTGKLNGTKISYRAWRIPRTALETFVTQNCNSPRPHKKEGKTEETIENTDSSSIAGESCSKMKHYIRDIMGEDDTTGSS